jgi:pimeloyl-ACP methyl ester carboxylesterase
VTEAKPLVELALPSFEQRTLDVHATRLRYQVGGPQGVDGTAVLLVHGFAGAGANFALLAPLLARTHRVVVPDLPGHGCSAALPALPSLAGFADRVAAVAEQEGTAPAVVVGHSMGGVVALRLAARRPDLVRGIVLAAAAGISTTTRLAEAFLAATSVIRPARQLARGRRRIARSPRLRALTFDGMSTSDGAAMSERAALGFLAASGLHTELVAPARALAREDVRRDLELVRCPALVLWGARDRQVPIDDAFEYARRLRAPLRVIPDCGHLLVGERADACHDAIEQFAMSI